MVVGHHLKSKSTEDVMGMSADSALPSTDSTEEIKANSFNVLPKSGNTPGYNNANYNSKMYHNLLSVRSILSIDESIDVNVVYPALLSNVAKAFRSRIPLATYTKNSLEYLNSFQGKDAVDVLAYVINTTDRNLALLLGRCLDAQGFFHDVTYEHRLRDSPLELYKFADNVDPSSKTTKNLDDVLPNGVFTLLADCYSPTCSRDRLCYSITCPRRLEQQMRLQKQSSAQVGRRESVDSLYRDTASKTADSQLWSTSVPPSVYESTSKAERHRQETIFELIQGEREFVEDLETTLRVFVRPLLDGNIIEKDRREKFVSDVFSNVADIYTINSKLLRKLLQRQRESHVVDKLGDIFVNVSNEFYPYVEYGAKQVFAKVILDTEKNSNSKFVAFLKECERLPELRKLPIESFLARPTTRLARYPLLLKPVMDKAAETHPDRTLVPQAIASIREVLSSINAEAGKAENAVKLSRLQKNLIFADGEQEDLRLNVEGRMIIRDGKLTMKRSSSNDLDVFVMLLDHVLLITRKKENGYLKVVRKSIPLELLVVQSDRSTGKLGNDLLGGLPSRGATGIGNKGYTVKSTMAGNQPDPSRAYMITITHLGRNGGTVQLLATSIAERSAWIESIDKQRNQLIEKKKRFDIVTLLNNVFPTSNRVHCSASYQKRLILGTDFGLYVGPEITGKVANDNDNPILEISIPISLMPGPNMDVASDPTNSIQFTRVLDMERISQIDILANYDMLLVLADKSLLSFPLQIIEVTDNEGINWNRRGKKIGSSVSFFKQGLCADRTLVCAVKSTTLTATIKVLEPVGLGVSNLRGKIGKLFRATNDSLKVFKEFYIPTESSSIHFLKTKLCVGCAKGFEIVDLESLNTQGLLDPSDETLDFVLKKDMVRPISIFRIRDKDFLLCYNEFGFYVDKLGRRSRKDWVVYWAGTPSNFAFIPPYIIAFEPSFIEIRHVDTGELQQIIPTTNLRLLNSHPDILHCVMDGPNLDFQHIFRLQPINYSNMNNM